jgi:protein O-GlcNAc transferase
LKRACLVLLVAALAGCGPDVPEERPIRDIHPPTPEEREARARLREARRLIEAKKYTKAEPVLRGLLELQPGNAEAWTLLGRHLMGSRRRQEGIAALRRAIELDADSDAARDLLFRTYYHRGEHEEGTKIARAWVKYTPKDEQALFRLGQSLYARGELALARKNMRQAARMRHSRADIRSELGLIEQALGDLDAAEAAQLDALDRDPRLAQAWFRLGSVLVQRHEAGPGDVEPREAIEKLERALDLEPGLLNAHVYLYSLLRPLGDGGDKDAARAAKRSWRRILETHGRQQTGWYGLATRPRKVDDFPAEEARLVRAQREAPTDPAPPAELAALLHARGHTQDASAAYARAIELSPNDAGLRARLGALLVSAGDTDGADAALNHALRLDPSDQRSRRLRGWNHLVAGRPDAAAADFDAVLAATPDDRLALKARALAWMASGRLAEGLDAVAAAGWL